MQTIRLRLTKPHPAQQQIIAEARRFNVVCAGRRFGKSRFGIERAAHPLLAGQPVGWFARLQEPGRALREIAHTFRPVTKSKSEQEHRLELLSGGVLDMWSSMPPTPRAAATTPASSSTSAPPCGACSDAWN